MKREVVLSEPALVDLLDINDSPYEVSDRVASKIIDGLEAAVNNLAEFPGMGSIPKVLLSLGIRQYRQVIEKPYRIIYETFADKIVVHVKLDGRRDSKVCLCNGFYEDKVMSVNSCYIPYENEVYKR